MISQMPAWNAAEPALSKTKLLAAAAVKSRLRSSVRGAPK